MASLARAGTAEVFQELEDAPKEPGYDQPAVLQASDLSSERKANSDLLSECDSEQKATGELLRNCHELADLLSLWREGYAELHGAVWELLTLVRETDGGLAARDPDLLEGKPEALGRDLGGNRKICEAKADAENELEACPEFTSLAIKTGSSGLLRMAEGFDCNGREPVAEGGKDRTGGGSPHGSDGESSSSFDLEVDEEWSKRLHDMEARLREKEKYEDDDDDPVLYLPFLHSRPMAQILDRIEEGSNEDVEPPSDADGASSASSRDSSVERIWASVRQAGPGAQGGPVPYFSPGGPHCCPGPKIPASFRTRGPMGPKEEGPLSKLMDQEVLDSE